MAVPCHFKSPCILRLSPRLVYWGWLGPHLRHQVGRLLPLRRPVGLSDLPIERGAPDALVDVGDVGAIGDVHHASPALRLDDVLHQDSHLLAALLLGVAGEVEPHQV